MSDWKAFDMPESLKTAAPVELQGLLPEPPGYPGSCPGTGSVRLHKD